MNSCSGSAWQVVDVGKTIVRLLISDPRYVHLLGKISAAVDIDFDGERQPRLQAHEHPAEVGIEIIKVDRQSAGSTLHSRPAPRMWGISQRGGLAHLSPSDTKAAS